MENQRVAHFGLVETVGRCLGVLYAYDGMVVSQEPDWLQHSMNVLAGLFRRYGLAYNFVKSHTMTFQSGILRSGMSEKAKSLKCTGVGYSYRVRLRSCIPCPECWVNITAGSMTEHRWRMNRTEPAINWSRLPIIQTEHQPQVYDMSFPRSTKWCPCPFPGCPWSSHTWNGLRLHSSIHHWGYRIRILEEHPNPFPRFEICRSQVPEGTLNTCHCALEKFKQGDERRLRRETLQPFFDTSKLSFQINMETLPPPETFPYLGWTIAYNSSDWAAVYQNLRKSRRRWWMIAGVL